MVTALNLTGLKRHEICRLKLTTDRTELLLVLMVSLFTVAHVKFELLTLRDSNICCQFKGRSRTSDGFPELY